MKRIVVAVFALAFGTVALAQAPMAPWRSPFTPAPSLGLLSPLDVEKHQKIMEQELAAWRARRSAIALRDR